MAVMRSREISPWYSAQVVMESVQRRAWKDSSAVLVRQCQQSAFKPEFRNANPATLPAQLEHSRNRCLWEAVLQQGVIPQVLIPRLEDEGDTEYPPLWSCHEHPWTMCGKGITWDQAHNQGVLDRHIASGGCLSTKSYAHLPEYRVITGKQPSSRGRQFPAPSSVCGHMTGSAWWTVESVMSSFRLGPQNLSWWPPHPPSYVSGWMLLPSVTFEPRRWRWHSLHQPGSLRTRG